MSVQAAGYGPALKLLERHGETAGFRELVTHRIPLARVRDALQTSLRPESGKVLVAP